MGIDTKQKYYTSIPLPVFSVGAPGARLPAGPRQSVDGVPGPPLMAVDSGWPRPVDSSVRKDFLLRAHI